MRNIRNFFILFILLFILAHAGPIYAADSLFSVAGCSGDPTATPCATTGNGYNTIIPLSKTVSFLTEIANKLLGEDNIIDRFLGELQPKDKSYRIGSEKLTAFTNQIQTASDTELIPADLQSLEQHNEASKPASMTSILCVYDPLTGALLGSGVKSSTIITTDDQSSTGTLTEGARRLASYTTQYVQESQDYRTQDIVIKHDAALPCDQTLQLPGQKKNQNPTVSQNANIYGSGSGTNIAQILFNITKDIFNLLLNNGGSLAFPTKIFGTGLSQFTGHADALTAGCATSSDLSSVSYATDEQKQKLCAAGGFVNSMYRPDAIDPTYKSDLNANDPNQQWDETITNEQPIAANSNAFAARIEAAGDYTNCTLTQADYQGTAVPGGECNTNWAGSGGPVTSCSGSTLPTTVAAGCGLCNKDTVKTMADDPSTVPEGIPTTMEVILSKAAAAYHVPPSSLLAVMYHEGGFSAGRFVWSDANVKKWSTCGQTMPNCDPNASTAQYPFGFFPVYFEQYKDAVLVDDPSRSGKTSLCNFMDVAYAAAKLMSDLAAYPMGSRPNITEPLCFNHPVNITKSPASCTDWNDDLVLKTHVYYAGYCPDPAIIAIRAAKGLSSQNEVAQPQYANWVLNWYNAFKCP